ncbi:hypothetical protein C0992_006115 [Termitomyces sp. T32_za158]|nr:hypothetical protein C0992_006115 [Termitomyces sp. T32_za158]
MSLKSARRDEEEESGPENHASLDNVFRDKQGNPIWFFLHRSIRLDWQRQNLTNEIQLNGGIVRPNDSDVDTVLVGQGCNRDNLQLAYNSHSKPSKRKRISLIMTTKTLPDILLSEYLILRVEAVEVIMSSRSCIAREDSEEYSWVTRHPWQSWRNRYNKNVTHFNDMIDNYVKLEKPERKQAYRLQRKSKEWQFLDEFTEEEKQPGNPPKRRRVDLSQDSPENRGKTKPSLAGKGKERMFSEDASDTNREVSPSPFYEDIPLSVPGPSKRTPITTYAHRSRKRPDVSPPYDSEPYTSQMTLVGTNHQTLEPRPRKMTVSDLSSQQRKHSKVTWGEAGVEVRQDRSPLTKEPHALVAPTPSAHIFSARASTKTSLPQHRPMARKTAQRDKALFESDGIVSSVPSYPNTSSRSRSVEPSISIPPSRLKTRQVGVAVGPSSITLPLLDESANEDYQPLVEVRSPDLIGETLEEERSVVDLLVNDVSERLQATEGESQIRMKDNPLAQNTANDPTSLDSDDAQIDNWLRQPQVKARISPPLEEPHASPDEMLQRFRQASINTLHSARELSVDPVPFSQARAGPRRQRHSAPVYNQGTFRGLSLTEQQPRTPATTSQSRLRRESTSSVESFPIAGTKASAVKKNIETEEKRTPYRPPVGTRAALLTEKQLNIVVEMSPLGQ